ncbi:hypothetical protein CPB86DRAFT_770726 [Serendipita vermifera]|nr:hypothetical protein CPB86DRAFT_770726 [Serendipita vermifera]
MSWKSDVSILSRLRLYSSTPSFSPRAPFIRYRHWECYWLESLNSIAGAFPRIVNPTVSDLLLPLVVLLPFMNQNLPQKFLALRGGPNAADGYNTLKRAEDDGAVTMAYGRLLDSIINFFAIGLVLYIIVRFYGYVTSDSILKHSTKRQYCRKEISYKTGRCAFCTSWPDGREDRETSALAPTAANRQWDARCESL